MCKSQAEGGQRCASHTRARFNALTPTQPGWDQAAIEYASTSEGERTLKQMAAQAVRGNDFDMAARCSNLTEQGIRLREANKEAAARIAQARRTSTEQHLNRDELAEVVAEACASNPDGWAVDPEDVLGSLEEPCYEIAMTQGTEAALEYLRSRWRGYRTEFLTTDRANSASRGRAAAMLLETERLAARLTRSNAA